jgi:hypothetical protein
MKTPFEFKMWIMLALLGLAEAVLLYLIAAAT